ncbi:exodeoxyribonuclease VII small subunit [bacterium]|nr:exodeoxyribonuclease VII small subunit [bacterium]
MKRKNDIKFEGALEKLEEIVQHLEEGDMPLDKSLKLFEEGIRLSRFCSKKIEQTKRRVEILVKDSEGKL